MNTHAPWIWPRRDTDTRTIDVTPDAIAAIRDLVVGWDEAEHGAPALFDREGQRLADLDDADDDSDSSLLRALEVFVECAKVERWSGVIRNPYADAHTKPWADSALFDVPDREVKELLAHGQPRITFDATPIEQALWRQAYLRPYGIDPKRPFGSGNVSQDVRAVADPNKTIASAAFTKLRKRLEARMMLLLQWFVQNAAIEPGEYRRDADGRWSRDVAAHLEQLSHDEWISRLRYEWHFSHEPYTKTIGCLAHLVWEARVGGTYIEQCERFGLPDLYGHVVRPSRAVHVGLPRERLSAALMYFPERTGDADASPFTLLALRIANGQGRFDDAQRLLEQSGLDASQRPRTDFGTVSSANVLHAEQLVMRYGSGAMSEAAFQEALFKYKTDPWCDRDGHEIWQWVWGLLHEPERFGRVDSLLLPHAQAVAAQLSLMRGAEP